MTIEEFDVTTLKLLKLTQMKTFINKVILLN